MSSGDPELVKFTSTFFSGLGGPRQRQPQQQEPPTAATGSATKTMTTRGGAATAGKVSSAAVARARPASSLTAQQNQPIRRDRDQQPGGSDEHAAAATGLVRPDTRFGAESSGKQLQYDVHWLELGLCKALTRAVSHLGYLHPTPVQSAAIPHILSGHDVLARAVTGSGKTAALMLPLVHRLVTTRPPGASTKHATPDGAPKRNYMNGLLRSLVLLPSRELGTQLHDFAASLSHFCDSLTTVLVIGGVAAQAQETALAKGADIVVATPGRIIDLLYNYSDIQPQRHTPFASKSSATVAGSTTSRGRKFDLSGVEVVALDECDELLSSETLRPQIEDIFSKFLPPLERRQTILLSATLTKQVDGFVETHMKDDMRMVDIGHVAFAAQLRQHFIRCGDVSSETTTPAQNQSVGNKPKKQQQKQKQNDDDDDDDDDDDSSEGSDNDNETPAIVGVVGPNADDVSVHTSKRKTPYLVAACRLYYGEAVKKTKAGDIDNDAASPSSSASSSVAKRVLIFAKHRTTVHRLCAIFNALGLNATELHGDLDVLTRQQAVADFSAGEVTYLFTTDVASRGLDLPAVSTVINFDLPPTLSAYVHRVGRTARIGKGGVAVSLVDDATDGDLMRKIVALSKSESAHQVTTVKRRDIPDADIAAATVDVNTIFPQVKSQLAREVVEKQLNRAEKKMERIDHLTTRQQSIKQALAAVNAAGNRDSKAGVIAAAGRAAAVAEAVLPAAKRKWALSRSERSKREEAAKEVYKQEIESKLSALHAAADEPNAAIQRARDMQITERRGARQKKQNQKEKEKAFNRAMRKKAAAKVQAGAVKKLKQKKLREAKREKRTAAGGGAGKKKGGGGDKKQAARKRYRRH